MPSPHDDDIVLTGFGVVSPIGTGTEAFWQSLVQHRGAVELVLPHEGASGRRWLAGHVRDFDAKAYVQPRKSLKVMCIETQIAFAATVLACRRAGIVPGTVNPDRLRAQWAGLRCRLRWDGTAAGASTWPGRRRRW